MASCAVPCFRGGNAPPADPLPAPSPAVTVQEYRSAAHALQDSQDQLSVFLRGYATYLAGEKRKE
jgi:anaphase-promoting complex subunit 8